MTEEEKLEIKQLIKESEDRSVERALLLLPEVTGNLIVQHLAQNKLNTEFYGKYPEFKDKKDVVRAIVEMTEGKNPLMDYEDLLKKSVPEIRKRL
ncbi:MAG: hypothetical protein Q8M94_22615, partial [Ignavibacteria bacterium]|nr:hypothetical protein [Ignavibacteria bacterium]